MLDGGAQCEGAKHEDRRDPLRGRGVRPSRIVRRSGARRSDDRRWRRRGRRLPGRRVHHGLRRRLQLRPGTRAHDAQLRVRRRDDGGGPFCDTHPDGTCEWATRSCTPACPGLGCAPACPNGVLKDVNGCDTCTCAPAAEGGRAGAPCTHASDCGGTYLCGFPEAAACAATGPCFAAEPVACKAYSPGCGCDGVTYNLLCNGLPSNYAPAPIFHAGDCSANTRDAASDDGGP